MKKTTDNKLFITQQEAARELGVSVQAVRSWIAAGMLPSIQWGRARKIPRRALMEFCRLVVEMSVARMKLLRESETEAAQRGR